MGRPAQTMAAAAKSEVEECIHRLPSNLEHGAVVQHASLISELALRAEKAIQDLDPMNDWTFLRVRSHKHEIMVCPEKEFMMIVVQDPNIKDAKVDDVPKG